MTEDFGSRKVPNSNMETKKRVRSLFHFKIFEIKLEPSRGVCLH